MNVVIAVDASLSGTGLVTWQGGRIRATTISTPASDPAPQRHHTITMAILTRRDQRYGHTLIVMEDRIKPSEEQMRGMTTLDLAELRGVIGHGAWVAGIPIVYVHPATLKVYATGNGRASKSAMVAAARGRLGEHLHVSNEDEADAAWLLAMTLHHYGRPLCALPRKNVAAVAKPPWPPFTLEGP